MTLYRHYRPSIEFPLRSALSVDDAAFGWGEYLYQCHESVLEKLEEITLVDVGPCPGGEDGCEECDG